MMFIWVIAIIVIVYYVNNGNGNNSFQLNSKNPEVILKERFVNGEIDEATYTRMNTVLKENK